MNLLTSQEIQNFKKDGAIVIRKKFDVSWIEKLKKGISICIFPEGGIPPEKLFLKKFKNGPFRLSIEQNVSIVPITMPQNKIIFPQNYLKGRPGFVKIKIHNPIIPNKLKEKN